MGLPLRHSAVESGFRVELGGRLGVPSVARAATVLPAKASWSCFQGTLTGLCGHKDSGMVSSLTLWTRGGVTEPPRDADVWNHSTWLCAMHGHVSPRVCVCARAACVPTCRMSARHYESVSGARLCACVHVLRVYVLEPLCTCVSRHVVCTLGSRPTTCPAFPLPVASRTAVTVDSWQDRVTSHTPTGSRKGPRDMGRRRSALCSGTGAVQQGHPGTQVQGAWPPTLAPAPGEESIMSMPAAPGSTCPLQTACGTYTWPSMQHSLNSMLFSVSVPVLSVKIYSTCGHTAPRRELPGLRPPRGGRGHRGLGHRHGLAS